MGTERFRGDYIADRKTLHNAVREEAGNRCVRCGHPQGDRMWHTKDVNKVIELEAIQSGTKVYEKFGGKTWQPSTTDSKSGVIRCAAGPWLVTLLQPCTEHCTHAGPEKLRILTVHHLDGHKANNAWWNLLALCQVCHLQVQGKVIPERPFLLPHTAWFVPYVCGFYAHYYGHETITREQADADPHRYLTLGQPWLYVVAGPAPRTEP